MEAGRKQKLLSKYIAQPRKKNELSQLDWMREDDQPRCDDESEESEAEGTGRRARIHSEDESEEGEEQGGREGGKEGDREGKRDRKFRKKLRKLLGLRKGKQVDQFMSNLQVEGISKQEILDYLSKNKEAIIKKQQVKQQPNPNKATDKFKIFQQQQSSDLQIPQQARGKTIYRNKDGTIREQSEKQLQQKRRKQVMDRLAEWQKGMRKQKDSDEDGLPQEVLQAKNNKIWDDPMKMWERQNPKKLLVSKYQGPPNRYNIRPGYRWDGVVRGNGFENRYLQEINLKKAKKDQQHMQYMKDL